MPKPKDQRMLCEKCWACDGTRKTLHTFNVGQSNELPAGSPCPLCEDGYFETGMTHGQLERQADALRAFMLALADLYAAWPTYFEPVDLNGQLVAHDQARDLLQKNAAFIQDARNTLGRPGWVPPFKPEPK